MDTETAIKKAMEMAENRVKKIAINTAAKMPSQKYLLRQMIKEETKNTKTVIVEGIKKDTSKVTMDIGIRA